MAWNPMNPEAQDMFDGQRLSALRQGAVVMACLCNPLHGCR
jgi:hypothetical protein